MAQFSSESLLSNAADQLAMLPKTQSAYAACDRYAVLGFIYYGIYINVNQVGTHCSFEADLKETNLLFVVVPLK